MTLNLNTANIPLLGASNDFTAPQEFKSSAGVGVPASTNGYTPLSVGGATSFGTWLSLANTSASGHTWNIISAGSGNAEGAGNLGITDLTGKSTIWLEGNTNTANLTATGTVGAAALVVSSTAGAAIIDALLFDENVSWYIDQNIQAFTSDPKGVKKLEFAPVDNEGNFSGVGSGFVVANAKFAINGYIYGNGPMMTMKKGERVRWYLVTLGEQFSVHTPHWHGNVVLHDGKRTDVVPLMQAQMETADMVPDNPGIWMFHCHIDDHMDSGMAALYKVEP